MQFAWAGAIRLKQDRGDDKVWQTPSPRQDCNRNLHTPMFKITFCLRRRKDLTPERFDTYWRDTHAPLVRQCAGALRIRRYVQSTRFDSALADLAGKVRGAPEPFDGVAELWFDSEESFRAGFATDEGRAAGRRLLEDEKRFIDLEKSPIWVATEREIIGDDA